MFHVVLLIGRRAASTYSNKAERPEKNASL
jgi:hypothetical protein